jgi:hypothetical protein
VKPLAEVLDQAEVWIDKNEVEHRIEEMPGRYALSVYNWLRSRANQIGFHYGVRLAGMSLPDEDTVAYLHVTEAIDREQHRIGENPEAWLVDKPLMRALLARVAVDRISRTEAAELGPRPRVEFRDVTPYMAAGFVTRPEPDLDEVTYGQRPGDETKVFLTIVPGDYDCPGDTVLATFVGNRLAAFRYEVEANKYGGYAEVVELEDNHAGKTEGMYGQIRRYRDPWTEVEYKTTVNLETAEIVLDRDPMTRVRNDVDPQITTNKEPEGTRGRYNVNIITRGPDTEIQAVQDRHVAAVNRIRANVLDDLTKDMP